MILILGYITDVNEFHSQTDPHSPLLVSEFCPMSLSQCRSVVLLYIYIYIFIFLVGHKSSPVRKSSELWSKPSGGALSVYQSCFHFALGTGRISPYDVFSRSSFIHMLCHGVTKLAMY